MMIESSKTKVKKATIGDIVEINTPAGFGYLQYTHDAGTHGQLVRVLPGLHTHRPSDLAALNLQRELYFVFYTLNYALRAGQAEVVLNLPVPEWAKANPLMRHAATRDAFGRVTRWRIISAASQLTVPELIRTPLLNELTPEQEKMSIHHIWPHPVMVKEMARGWTPERDEELRLQDKAEKEKRKTSTSPEKSCAEFMQHYLYFPEKSNAKEVSELLRSRGFSANVSKSADGENWLVLALKAPPTTGEQMEELRDELGGIALQFGGEYDGWEVATESLGDETQRNRRVN